MSIIRCLETHAYAPELNTLHLRNGVQRRVPGCTTIKAARARAFPKITPTLAVEFKWRYPHGTLAADILGPQVRRGRYQGLGQAWEDIKKLKAQLNQSAGKPLAGGSVMPAPIFEISAKWVG